MSYPNDVSVRTVFGQYLKSTGLAAAGTVTFTPSHRIEDANDATILSTPITVTLDTNGEFEIDLPCTDDLDLSPRGWYYTATIRIKGARPYSFRFYLPTGDGTDVDITKLDTVEPVTTSPLGTDIPRGLVGAQGPQGPTGPAGPAGGSASTAALETRLTSLEQRPFRIILSSDGKIVDDETYPAGSPVVLDLKRLRSGSNADN